MVTKVRNLRQSAEFASNFEFDPENTSGLNFHVHDGSVVRLDKTLFELSGQGVALPGAGVYFVYVDMAGTPPTLNAETTITSGNYVILYRVTATGVQITNVEDLRSWTAASIGDDLLDTGGGASPVTTFDTLLATYSPDLFYKFNQTDREGSIINTGAAGSDWDLPIFSTAIDAVLNLWTRLTGGDFDGNFGMMMSGWGSSESTRGFQLDLTGLDLSFLTGSSTGTWVVNAALAYDTESANGAWIQFRNNDDVGNFEFEWGMFNDNAEIDFRGSTGTEDWEVQSTSGINQDPTFPVWKQYVLVQPGDGSGPSLYINGVDSGTSVVAGREDFWFDSWDTDEPTILTVGASYSSPTLVTDSLSGAFDTIAYTQTALTPTQIADLYTAYNTGVAP